MWTYRTMEVLICGGGIGGLTAAVALQREGIPMRALSLLGLSGAVLGDHVPMERIVLRRRDGKALMRFGGVGHYREPGICVHRAHLQRIPEWLTGPMERRVDGFQAEEGTGSGHIAGP